MYDRLSQLLGTVLLSCTLVACDDPSPHTQNCPVERYGGSDTYGIQYELTLPASCPVPLGARGETKRAGARIFDTGNRDFTFAEVAVENSDGKLLVQRLFRFVSDETGRYGAVPRTEYPAGTGSPNTFNFNNLYDFGYFAVTNNQTQSQPADPYGVVRIKYRDAPMNASIGGPAVPLGNTTQTWGANGSGGIQPYTYTWYRDGNWVGSGSTYTGPTGTRDFHLLVEVTDGAMVVRKAVMPVDVDGVRVSITGPNMVWYSQNGGTWTASVEGGYGPYEFDWFLNGLHAASGEYFSLYPGEGQHDILVRVRDASGTSHEGHKAVEGVGNDMCAPLPPRETCEGESSGD
jgi:hypothetical protein